MPPTQVPSRPHGSTPSERPTRLSGRGWAIRVGYRWRSCCWSSRRGSRWCPSTTPRRQRVRPAKQWGGGGRASSTLATPRPGNSDPETVVREWALRSVATLLLEVPSLGRWRRGGTLGLSCGEMSWYYSYEFDDCTNACTEPCVRKQWCSSGPCQPWPHYCWKCRANGGGTGGGGTGNLYTYIQVAFDGERSWSVATAETDFGVTPQVRVSVETTIRDLVNSSSSVHGQIQGFPSATLELSIGATQVKAMEGPERDRFEVVHEFRLLIGETIIRWIRSVLRAPRHVLHLLPSRTRDRGPARVRVLPNRALYSSLPAPESGRHADSKASRADALPAVSAGRPSMGEGLGRDSTLCPRWAVYVPSRLLLFRCPTLGCYGTWAAPSSPLGSRSRHGTGCQSRRGLGLHDRLRSAAHSPGTALLSSLHRDAAWSSWNGGSRRWVDLVDRRGRVRNDDLSRGQATLVDPVTGRMAILNLHSGAVLARPRQAAAPRVGSGETSTSPQGVGPGASIPPAMWWRA